MPFCVEIAFKGVEGAWAVSLLCRSLDCDEPWIPSAASPAVLVGGVLVIDIVGIAGIAVGVAGVVCIGIEVDVMGIVDRVGVAGEVIAHGISASDDDDRIQLGTEGGRMTGQDR